MAQWLRECQLVVVDAESKGVDLSGLRIQFEITKMATPTPNPAKIRVCNLSGKTAKKAKKEFQRIQLKAGYSGESDVIFDGSIIESRIGGEGTDTHLDIIGGDGDGAYTFSTVSSTLAADCSMEDVFRAAANPLRNWKDGGVSLGHIDAFDSVKFPRGRVLFGMARDVIESICYTGNKTWSIQNGKLQVLDHKNTLPSVFVISENTGMIGVPEEVNDGVRVKCLLNPKLMVDGQVKIESNHISEIAASASGFYRVLKIVDVGDTHGDDWYSEMTCVAMEKSGGNTTDSEGR